MQIDHLQQKFVKIKYRFFDIMQKVLIKKLFVLAFWYTNTYIIVRVIKIIHTVVSNHKWFMSFYLNFYMYNSTEKQLSNK